jgi:hypothetical protein
VARHIEATAKKNAMKAPAIDALLVQRPRGSSVMIGSEECHGLGSGSHPMVNVRNFESGKVRAPLFEQLGDTQAQMKGPASEGVEPMRGLRAPVSIGKRQAAVPLYGVHSLSVCDQYEQ